jgi:hypothetical protein
MLEAVKLGRDIARHHVFAPFNAGEMIPGNAVNEDATLAEMVASNLAVYGHPTSTVPMGGPTDPWAVVDSLGLVQGLDGLRVVDASIIPEAPLHGDQPHGDHVGRADLPAGLRLAGDMISADEDLARAIKDNLAGYGHLSLVTEGCG